MAERVKWSCDKCKTERFRGLQEDLQNALRQIDELKTRNRELEEKLLLVGAEKRDTVTSQQKAAKCMVIGDSLARNCGAEHTGMMVECFPGIRTEELHRVIEKRIPELQICSKWSVGALNERLDWVANTLGVTFVDPNSWIEDGDFARDELHLNGRGNRRLGQP
jgi:hypothetical protein